MKTLKSLALAYLAWSKAQPVKHLVTTALLSGGVTLVLAAFGK